MESILINPSNKSELNLIKSLLEKMRIKNSILTDEQKEDIGLYQLMQEADRNEFVSREQIMKKLGKA